MDYGAITVETDYTDEGGNYAVRARILTAGARLRIPASLVQLALDDALTTPHLAVNDDALTVADDYGTRLVYRLHWDDYVASAGGYLVERPD